MMTIAAELQTRFKAELLPGNSDEAVYMKVRQVFLPDALALLAVKEAVLIANFALENFAGEGMALLYVFEFRNEKQLLALVAGAKDNRAASAAADFPAACYFEREVADGFGVQFSGSLDTRRLFLHEAYPEGFHPLRKSFVNRAPEAGSPGPAAAPYAFRECAGEGVYQIPVGPVHAGIIEPGHFRFSATGETIFDLEIRHFYKHRGLEKLAEGRSALEGAAVAEAVSGDESAANALAFSMAAESIGGTSAPQRAWQVRTLLAELERVYSHLGDLAGMALDVAFPVGAAGFFNLREEVLRQNALLTGSRFAKGIIVPGGLSRDVPKAALDGLAAYLGEFPARLERALSVIYDSGWVIDRFETTGVIRKELVAPLNLTGPAARASGVQLDTRLDHPYGLYPRLRVAEITRPGGDVMARVNVKADEIKNSAEMAKEVLGQMQGGPVRAEVPVRDGWGMALVEAARGQNLHWLYLRAGCIERYKVRTASFCNWPAIEHAVIGNIVADFPVINKSLNLSYAGNDL